MIQFIVFSTLQCVIKMEKMLVSLFLSFYFFGGLTNNVYFCKHKFNLIMKQMLESFAQKLGYKVRVVDYQHTIGFKASPADALNRAIYVIHQGKNVEYIDFAEFTIGRSMHLVFGKKRNGMALSRKSTLNSKEVKIIFLNNGPKTDLWDLAIKLHNSFNPSLQQILLD